MFPCTDGSRSGVDDVPGSTRIVVAASSVGCGCGWVGSVGCTSLIG
jgi:hypothetical protein